MTINLRLVIGFGVVILMMLVLSFISIHRVNFIDSTITEITEQNAVKQRYAINFRGSVHDRAIALRDISLARTQGELDSAIQDMTYLGEVYQKSAIDMDKIMSSGVVVTAEEKRIYSKINNIESQTLPFIAIVIEAKHADNIKLANEVLFNQAKPAFIQWLASINEFIDYQEMANQKATKEVKLVASSFQSWMVSLTSLAIIIGLFVAYRISFQVKQSVGGDPQEAAKVVSNFPR